MNRLAWLALAMVACAGPTGAAEPDDHAGAPQREHADEHDAVPRTVTLSDAVIQQAGITTAPAEKRRIAPTVRLPGEIVAHPDREASVAARMGGVIDAVRVRPGDAVKRGAVLVTVRAPNLQSLRASSAALRAKAASAKANAERLEALVASRMASRQEAVAARANADALAAEARAAKERLRALGVHRARGAVTFDVHAPMDGVVLERMVVAGTPVTAESIVATMVSAEEVWFLGHVFERDLGRLELGSPARVRLNAYPDEMFSGTVEYVAHKVDPGARTVSARIPLRNPDGRLRLGLYGTAHVVAAAESPDPVLSIPNSAVTRLLGKTVAFVRREDGSFEVHDILTGATDHEHTEVVHGLNEGEQVVIEGAFTVKSALLRDVFAEEGH